MAEGNSDTLTKIGIFKLGTGLQKCPR